MQGGRDAPNVAVSAMMRKEAKCKETPPPDSSCPTSNERRAASDLQLNSPFALFQNREVTLIHFLILFTSSLLKSANIFALIRQPAFSLRPLLPTPFRHSCWGFFHEAATLILPPDFSSTFSWHLSSAPFNPTSPFIPSLPLSLYHPFHLLRVFFFFLFKSELIKGATGSGISGIRDVAFNRTDVKEIIRGEQRLHLCYLTLSLLISCKMIWSVQEMTAVMLEQTKGVWMHNVD